MKVRILGRGSVGTSVAANLSSSEDIAFIVDEERYSRYPKEVLFNGSVLPVPMISASSHPEKVDLLIVAVKNFQLKEALSTMTPFVSENTVILPILNGIDAEMVLSEAFGEEKVLYGFIQGLSVQRSGAVVESTSKGKITFGEKNNERSARVERISSYFTSCGMNHVVPENILHEKWCKFMNNTAFNTLTAILEAEYCAVSKNENLMDIARMVFLEVQAVGETMGVHLTEKDMETVIAGVKSLGGHGRSSMLEDVLAHRETENDYFCGSIVRLAEKNGIMTPYCSLLGKLLEAKRHVVNFCER